MWAGLSLTFKQLQGRTDKGMRGLVALLFACCLVGTALGHKYFSPFDFLKHERATVKLDTAIAINVSPTLLSQSGEWVTVTWSGVDKPSKEDWIGIYSPPINGSIDPVNHAPIKFQYSYYSPTHMSEGKGSLKFKLVNMRADIIFGFIRGGFENPVVAAVSDLVTFKNPNEPLQGHLALTGNPTEMILQWVTRDATQPQVKWGTESGTYTHTKQAVSSKYTDKDMCGPPATDFGYRDAGLLHQVTMDNLTPGTRYYYMFGDTYGWSEEFSFRAAPTPGPDVTTRVVAYGDMGIGQPDDSRQVDPAQQPALNTSRLVFNQLNQTDMVLHIGDISYARGYASVWDDFMAETQPIAARVPYMVCIGNHERDYPNSGALFPGTDSGGECGVAHERRFPMPRPALDQPWYGIDYGSIHFVLMSTEHDFRTSSLQYKWLDNHFKTVNRTRTPWLVFAGHRPMYIDSTNNAVPDGDTTVAIQLQKYLEPLLKQYKVDLALWGHHHSYQRTCPVYNNACTPGATTHIVIGMGGQGLSQNIKPIKPDWLVLYDIKHWGYSRMTGTSNSLLFEYVRDDDGKVHDSVTFKK